MVSGNVLHFVLVSLSNTLLSVKCIVLLGDETEISFAKGFLRENTYISRLEFPLM